MSAVLAAAKGPDRADSITTVVIDIVAYAIGITLTRGAILRPAWRHPPPGVAHERLPGVVHERLPLPAAGVLSGAADVLPAALDPAGGEPAFAGW